MRIEELLEKKLIVKISENEYICNTCNRVFSKLGIPNHHFYNHEDEGIKKKEKLRQIALINNNKLEMKKKISEKTKESFKKDIVKKNFNKYVERIKIERIGEGNPMYGKHHTKEWKQNHSNLMKNFNHSEETKDLLRKINTGKKHTLESIQKMRNVKIGKKDSYETKRRKSISQTGRKAWNKFTIKKIKKCYPFFSQIEEMRYNPDKPDEKEIQVHCKNHLCPNSKEQNGWFTPKIERLKDRIYALENEKGNDGNFFYCCDECKNQCPLFGLNPIHYLNKVNEDILYTPGEYETFRQEVLRRQKEEYGYNFCEYCYTEENLHIHHEKPQKINPLMILDPDNGIVLCQDCHYIVGHKGECSTRNLANKICIGINNDTI
jgi:hypothetical protein